MSVAATNTTVGARVTATCASVKRQRVRYQSIIATRRGCIQHSRNEPRVALPRVDFRNRAILATKRLPSVSIALNTRMISTGGSYHYVQHLLPLLIRCKVQQCMVIVLH